MKSPELQTRIESLFEMTLALDQSARARVLEEHSQRDPTIAEEVRSLLHALDRSSGYLESGPRALCWRAAPDDGDDWIGRQVGRYRLEAQIGRGGMGSVYRARQNDPPRAVAVKLLDRGLFSDAALRRFSQEAEVLARIQHPGVAHVYEAGAHREGALTLAYIAMELIEGGQSLHVYAASRNLDVAGKLDLFIQVCDAVHHAHQRGVIHRDLKPDNILVTTAGRVKVIDFGVARASRDGAVRPVHTTTGQLVGTVQYMSPEQCDSDPNDIDIRSDVYSLGVVLYELLTGAPPYQVGQMAHSKAVRVICEQPPMRPSSHDPRLKGDVETIVLKALEKVRDRRYGSASDLAEDLRRRLSARPVLARRATRLYTAQRFAARNRAAVAGVALAVLGLVGGLITAITYAVQAKRSEQSAVQDARTARQVTACLTSVFDAFAPQDGPWDADPAWLDLDELLDRSVDAIVAELSEQPAEQWKLLMKLASVNYRLSRQDRSASLASQALELARRMRNDEQVCASLVLHGQSLVSQRMFAPAEADYREAVALGESHDVQTFVDERAQVGLASLLTRKRDFAGARSLLEQARASHNPVIRYDALRGLGTTALLEEQSQEALEYFREVLRHDDAAVYSRADAGLKLARVLWRQGDDATCTAEVGCVAALLENKRAQTSLMHAELAAAQLIVGEYSDAARRHPGPLTASWRMALYNLALALEVHGELADAGGIHRELYRIRRRCLGEFHADTSASLYDWARLLAAQGDTAALNALREPAERLFASTESLPPDHPNRSGALLLLGEISLGLGEIEDARYWLDQCVEQRRQTLGPDACLTAYAESVLARCLAAQGQHDAARELALAALPRLETLYKPDSARIQNVLGFLREQCRVLGRDDEARQIDDRRSAPEPSP